MQRLATKEKVELNLKVNEQSDLPLLVPEEQTKEGQTNDSASIGNLETDLTIDTPLYSKHKNLTLYGRNIHFTSHSKLESTGNVTLTTNGTLHIECDVNITGVLDIDSKNVIMNGKEITEQWASSSPSKRS